MHLMTILALALSCNLDNIMVGLAYGTRRIRLPLESNLLIALITSVGTLVTMLLGQDLARLYFNTRIANYLGAGIIIIAGLYVLIQSCWQRGIIDTAPLQPVLLRTGVTAPKRPQQWLRELARLTRDPQLVDWDYSGSIDLGEAAVLGLALTLNNLPNGFAAGMLGLNIGLTTIAVSSLSLLTFWAGIWLGLRYTSRMLGDWGSPAAGIMLIMIGVYTLFH
ncbi:MAG: hypothetical protein ABSC17_00685 [Thermacetogeniaceae bacterium]